MFQATRLFPVISSWPGILSLSARPRGGDWLKDEICAWQQQGVHVIVSFLTSQEDGDLELQNEAITVQNHGMEFISFPIEDRQVPQSFSRFSDLIDTLEAKLNAGKNVLLHCRQGIGRSGMAAASLLIRSGLPPGAALDLLSVARGITVPETREQKAWVSQFSMNRSVGV